MSRKIKKTILVGFDSLVIIASGLIALLFLNPYVSLTRSSVLITIGTILIIYILLAAKLKLFSKINRYTSIREAGFLVSCVTAAYLVSSFITVILTRSVSFRFMILSYMFSVLSIVGGRVLWRIYNEHQLKIHKLNRTYDHQIRTLIIGAGQGGNIFIRSLKKDNGEIIPVGIVDDDKSTEGTYLYNVPVLGQIDDIPELVLQRGIEQITIAIPSLKPNEYESILELCNQVDVKINQMPSLEEVLKGNLSVSQFREIDVVDLLGREEVQLDMQQISEKLTGKTVLVSGAGGSIGSEICRQVANFNPKRIVLLGHGENSIYLIHKELKNKYGNKIDFVPIIADVQDRKRIFKIMEQYKPDRVYHAAAHKHVPLMEYNPTEAVKNNVFGTKNMAEAAKAANVRSFVMVSTDKAVNPPNVMGATKRIAEMIVTGLNEAGKTKFVAVRFGNVLGSRGSVIPLFKEQIQNGGPITITDFRMTRYFMTIPEASRLVLQAGALANGGEIFVLDMGESVKIVDLAKKMVKLSGYTEEEIPIVESGIRPGEKLYEDPLGTDEYADKQVFDKIFVGNVLNKPIDKVMDFICETDKYSETELKNALISFASVESYNNKPKTRLKNKQSFEVNYSRK